MWILWELMDKLWMRYITVYTVHALALWNFICCTPTILGNDQMLRSFPYVKIPMYRKRVNMASLDNWFSDLFCTLFFLVWVIVWCWSFCQRVVTRTHVWYLPLHYRMCICRWQTTGQPESKSYQDTDWGGVVTKPSKIISPHNGKVPSHRYFSLNFL